MILALSLGTIKYVDARTQLSPVPSMSVVNGSVTCGAIEAQILSQTPLSVANSCTKKIRAVRVCNTLVVHHECKRNLHCSRPTTVAYDFSCLKKIILAGFLSAVATQIDQDKVPENDYFSPYYGFNLGIFLMNRSIIRNNIVQKKKIKM